MGEWAAQTEQLSSADRRSVAAVVQKPFGLDHIVREVEHALAMA